MINHVCNDSLIALTENSLRIVDTCCYTTQGEVFVSRSLSEIAMKTAVEELLVQINSQRGGWLASNYEYPGRYNRWARGFVNPPLKLVTRDNFFTLTALNSRGMILLPYFAECLYKQSHLQEVNWEQNRIVGSVKTTEHFFSEEERSKQPSVFSVIREILSAFKNSEDNYLGLYGAFGYDLIFQFEPMPKRLKRSTEQRDLVLYLPDELIIVDYYSQRAFRLQYEFETKHGNTKGLPRSGEIIDHKGKHRTLTQHSDHQSRDYENQVQKALDYFRRGELFEVVPSQSFFQSYDKCPHKLFQRLQQINPSPYGFIFNLGGEYLIGASPEIFVRVEGRRVETCPISGIIRRGKNAIEDATQILQLLNSRKDEAELTMCTDVDRNDKSRICIPG